MNEPVTPSGRMDPGKWLAGEFAGFCYVQYISLDQQDRPRQQIAREWLKNDGRSGSQVRQAASDNRGPC